MLCGSLQDSALSRYYTGIPIFQMERLVNMPSKVGAEIHRRLADGQPPEVIAQAVNRSVSTVYAHRAADCQCPEQEAATPPLVVDPLLDPLLSPDLPSVESLLSRPAVRPSEVPTLQRMLKWGRELGIPQGEVESMHKAFVRNPKG